MKFLLLFFTLILGPRAFAFQGIFHATVDEYPYHLDLPTHDQTPYLTLELNDKYKLDRNWRFQWKLFGLSNTVSRYQPESYYGDVHEAFFEYKSRKAPFKMRFGMNTVNWAVVDVNSPSDVVNPEVIFQPMRIFRQGAPMAEFQIGREALNFDLVYIPVQRSPLLPSADSRWLPRKFLFNIPNQGSVYLPPTVEYTYQPTEYLERSNYNNYGGKIASHLGSFDLQFTYFEGQAPQPKILPTPIDLDLGATPTGFVARNPIHLTMIDYRQRTTGLGFVWAGEKLILRGETAYQSSLTNDDRIQPWNWASVLGVETNLDVGTGSMTVLAQLYYTKNPQAADNLISSTYRLFDQTGLLGVRWAYSEALTLTASALYTVPTEGMYYMLSGSYKTSDRVTVGLSWNDFGAVKDGLLKTYQSNYFASLDIAVYF